jgi:hypothetical protein
MRIKALWLMLALLLVGCVQVAPGSRDVATPAGPLVLSVGDAVALSDATLRFVGVAEDSRCPSQVTCAWSGRGVLQFRLETADGQSSDFELSTLHSPAKTTQAVKAGRVFELLALEPYPVLPDQPIPQQDYRATVAVSPLATADCPLREDDPNGYLTLVCRHVHEQGIGVKPANPAQYDIAEIHESTENGRAAVWMRLTCCGMGDIAVIDVATGEVLSFQAGAY